MYITRARMNVLVKMDDDREIKKIKSIGELDPVIEYAIGPHSRNRKADADKIEAVIKNGYVFCFVKHNPERMSVPWVAVRMRHHYFRILVNDLLTECLTDIEILTREEMDRLKSLRVKAVGLGLISAASEVSTPS